MAAMIRWSTALSFVLVLAGCQGDPVAVPTTDAGADAPGETAADAGLPPGVSLRDGCPTGRGPEMANLGTFCMDRTEVTRSNFNQFLGDVAGRPEWPAGCGSPSYPAARADFGDHPATNVTFCEAQVYCRWAGKRLCGARAGGSQTVASALTATSMWTFACWGGETARAYPYGEAYQRTSCLGERLAGTSPGTVAVNLAATGCRSAIEPFRQVIDLSGGVGEWEDACSTSDVTGACRVRGGSWNDMEPTALRCDGPRTEPKGSRLDDVGFRCCYQP